MISFPGGEILLQKIQEYKPLIAVFNGKGIYEVFSGKKSFPFGRQEEPIPGTATHVWVMPSSSARCAQLPRAQDKVPFYAALRKFRDHLKGHYPDQKPSEVVFSDVKLKTPTKASQAKGGKAKAGATKKKITVTKRALEFCHESKEELAAEEVKEEPS